MDNELNPNDPYNNMETAQDDIKPEFLNSTQGKAKAVKEKAQKAALKAAEAAATAAGGAAGAAAGAGGAAGAASGASGAVNSAKQAEKTPGGFSFTGKGKNNASKKGKFDGKKMSAGAALGIGLLGAILGVAALGSMHFQIAGIDFNLQQVLGFTPTVSILQEAANYISQDYFSKGEVPDQYAGRLAEQGVMVGQVTDSGDFVRTNTYVADADKLKELAVLGNFQVTPSNGELAVLYNDEVIEAKDFVAKVNADPVLYAKVTEAEDIGALYYYGKDANAAFEEMGVSRSLFANWEDTGNLEENEENFKKILEKGINEGSSVTVNGFFPSSDETESNDNSFSKNITEDSDASEIVSAVASDTKADSEETATAKAAQLLNTAISASEPYLAAKAFMVVEEPIQRARISGEGPIHELMNTLQAETEVEYTDATSGETENSKVSILTTSNFAAAVGGGKFSQSEAANFSRDRALMVTKTGSKGNIKDTTISSKGQKESSIVIGVGNASSANGDELSVVNDSVDKAVVQKNSDLFPSMVGGNRIIEGGAFISNTINRKAIGAMGADSEEIARYHQETKVTLARMAAAERATKSPFDITSPYTFMGSIVYGLASSTMRSNASNGNKTGSVIGAIAGLTGDSTKTLFGTATADGDDDSYELTHGENCNTVNSANNIEGDIYCTAKQVISTGYMERTGDEWKDKVDEDEYKLFVTVAMDREATVGVNDAESCEKWREKYNIPVVSTVSELLGLYNVCKANAVEGFFSDELGMVDKVGTGEYYSFTEENDNKKKTKELGGYALYDQVSSLLEGRDSEAAMIREAYYAKHPRDNSPAGKLARISGMTKHEAEIALAYADYLTVIANYNPLTRFSFGEVMIQKPSRPLVEHANKVSGELYAVWHGRTEYDDLRGRIRVS